MMNTSGRSIAVVTSFLLLVGCSSSQVRARKEQRDRVVTTSKAYCEFINGEQNPDIDVVLNISMGNRCDLQKNFSITSYRTPSDISGVLYCCSIAEANAAAPLKTKIITPMAAPTPAPSPAPHPVTVPAPKAPADAAPKSVPSTKGDNGVEDESVIPVPGK